MSGLSRRGNGLSGGDFQPFGEPHLGDEVTYWASRTLGYAALAVGLLGGISTLMIL